MKLLIVEDEPKIAASIKKGFEQESYIVDVAEDGETGYDLASTEGYDAIILDRMLPGIDGMDICTKLRSEKNPVPILMLTAKGEVSDRIEGLNIGADDYLPKPFSFEELLARVRALIRRPKTVVINKLVSSDLTLDPINFSVSRADQPINLSKKEFALLEYLLRNQSTIVTKDQIMQKVWNFDTEILPNTVEVYIGYLRNKIDKPFKKSPPLIHTVRGFGYRLGANED